MKANITFLSPSHYPEVIVALAVCGSILFLLIVLLLTVLFRMQAQPPGYHHIANREDHA
jgi:lysosomal acid phosphatase